MHHSATRFYSADSGSSTQNLGVVVIGRNEGVRLKRCLESVLPVVGAVVYVDSGSTDGSAEMARALGVVVHPLDLSRPFTAARARNEGVSRLRATSPNIDLIQFVDGDCEVVAGWLDVSASFLRSHPGMAAVCGRRRERHPDRSIYNLLCDLEWNTPVGEAKAFGGDVLMRDSALRQVDGYRADLIAGEEPELCVRLRQSGWLIWRLDAEMTWHDAAMSRFDQWWKRCVRTGFAFAEGARLHGAPPERHWVRESRSAWTWGACIPLFVLFLVAAVGPGALLALAVYPLQVMRLALRLPAPNRARWARAFFFVAGKFPETVGQCKCWLAHMRNQRTALIEYK